ncbi:MAG: PAS domain-containing protein [Candidatus Competibacteraceae bacterium]|nr:PAS domain-containing protein [Candidatus Competibacteraceae bacterium]
MVRREQRYRHTLDALVHRQELLEGLLNALPDPVILKDAEHRWVIVNDAFCAVANQTREALLGKSDYDFSTTRSRCILGQGRRSPDHRRGECQRGNDYRLKRHHPPIDHPKNPVEGQYRPMPHRRDWAGM